ncbi:MAG TPA: hypothetical protein DIC34_02530 [Treponema sp.]|nr:MAG: hypothetical protein A2Y36_16610 [Treponema sp. GWA1_62_8]HCM25418.1 hypothetical protein [Treponema sp.]
MEDRMETSARIRAARAALEEKGILMGELHHRGKNNPNLTLSLISMQRDGADSMGNREGLNDLEGRVRSFSPLHVTLDFHSTPLHAGIKVALNTVLIAAEAPTNVMKHAIGEGLGLSFSIRIEAG